MIPLLPVTVHYPGDNRGTIIHKIHIGIRLAFILAMFIMKHMFAGARIINGNFGMNFISFVAAKLPPAINGGSCSQPEPYCFNGSLTNIQQRHLLRHLFEFLEETPEQLITFNEFGR